MMRLLFLVLTFLYLVSGLMFLSILDASSGLQNPLVFPNRFINITSENVNLTWMFLNDSRILIQTSPSIPEIVFSFSDPQRSTPFANTRTYVHPFQKYVYLYPRIETFNTWTIGVEWGATSDKIIGLLSSTESSCISSTGPVNNIGIDNANSSCNVASYIVANKFIDGPWGIIYFSIRYTSDFKGVFQLHLFQDDPNPFQPINATDKPTTVYVSSSSSNLSAIAGPNPNLYRWWNAININECDNNINDVSEGNFEYTFSPKENCGLQIGTAEISGIAIGTIGIFVCFTVTSIFLICKIARIRFKKEKSIESNEIVSITQTRSSKSQSLPSSPKSSPAHHLPPNYEQPIQYTHPPSEENPQRNTFNIKESLSHIIVKSKVPVITDVEVLLQINEGNFGEVYKGVWHDTPVALKKLKDEDKKEFEREAAMLFTIGSHPHVVQFFGLYTSPANETYIVMEFMTKGSLLDTLRNQSEEFKFSDLLDFIIGACCGMVFLESKKILHRDLACRNILVTKIDDRYRVKVSDFGLAKGLDEERAYYKPGEAKPIPVRWTAPEVLNLRRYTTAADIWSFGVTAWEILDFGKIPYNWLSNKEVSIEVPRGERLPKPDFCSEELWQILLKCFAKDPKERPTFRGLLSQLSNYRNALPNDEATAVSKVAMEDKALYQPSENFVEVSATPENSAEVSTTPENSAESVVQTASITKDSVERGDHYNRDEELIQASPQPVKDFGYLK